MFWRDNAGTSCEKKRADLHLLADVTTVRRDRPAKPHHVHSPKGRNSEKKEASRKTASAGARSDVRDGHPSVSEGAAKHQPQTPDAGRKRGREPLPTATIRKGGAASTTRLLVRVGLRPDTFLTTVRLAGTPVSHSKCCGSAPGPHDWITSPCVTSAGPNHNHMEPKMNLTRHAIRLRLALIASRTLIFDRGRNPDRVQTGPPGRSLSGRSRCPPGTRFDCFFP